MTLARALIFAIVALFAAVRSAEAHEVRPAYMEIHERTGSIDVVFKQPVNGAGVLRLDPHLSSVNLDREPDVVQRGAGFQTRTWRAIDLQGAPLDGQTLSIVGLERTMTDALVVVHFADGQALHQVLTPDRPSLVLEPPKSGAPVWAYFRLGVEHILFGFDHLLFIFGLVLLAPRLATLVKVITAFTIAHSITLAATALGIISLAPARIEMLVAMSILFVAVEVINARRGTQTVTQRWPWSIAFAFGLLHGSALAGALAEIGLPRANLAGALLLFNFGVEAGQLVFVGGLCALGFVIARTAQGLATRFAMAPAYLIGVAAVFWMCERFVAALAA